MKILHIDCGKVFRGGQRQALMLHKELIKRGIQSYFLCNPHGYLFKMDFENKHALAFHNELDLKSYLNLYKFLKIHKPDIIQVHEAHGLGLAVFATLNYNIPIVSTRRVDFPIRKHFINKLKYKKSNIIKWVAISDAVKQSLINFGVHSNRIIKIYSASDVNNVKIEKSNLEKINLKYNLKNNFVVGSILSFVGHKDPFTLIKSFELLYKKYKKVKLLILGEGPYKEEVIEMVKTMESKDNIYILGFKDNIYEYLSLFHIFIITSRKEALCSSIIDALSMEKPVVATRVGGIPEIIKDHYNGLLNESGDYEGLSKSLLKLISNKEFYSFISKNAYESSHELRGDVMANKYINLYSEILHEERKS